jgi:hypothetical protein
MAKITVEIDAKDAGKIAQALSHVYREIYDRERDGEPLILLAQQIATKAKLDTRYGR